MQNEYEVFYDSEVIIAQKEKDVHSQKKKKNRLLIKASDHYKEVMTVKSISLF